MFPFSKLGRIDHTERKALLFAFLFCALFIVLLSVSVPAKRTHKKVVTTIHSPVPLTKPAEPSEPKFIDPLEQFRVKPENFNGVDFRNFSYGIYTPSSGKPIDLTLVQSLKPLNDSGWIKLKDVFYTDLTGDGEAEAIVRLWHVSCEGSCDSGSDLFYIYSTRNGKLTNIWRYETGSYAYGCGLKSFTLEDRQMKMELFGRCSSQAMTSPGPVRFVVEDLTSIIFEFDGSRFKTASIKYISAPWRNVKNWEPEIEIYYSVTIHS